MRQATRSLFAVSLVTAGLAIASARSAEAAQALSDTQLGTVMVGEYPDCQEVPGETCRGGIAEYCWLDDSDPQNKRCKLSCHHGAFACEECPVESCNDEEDCRPCILIKNLGPLPESQQCQPQCNEALPCNVFEDFESCGTGVTCNSMTIYIND